MKRLIFVALIGICIPTMGTSQVFVSDSIHIFSYSKDGVTESTLDTTYTIERLSGVINLTHRTYGMSKGSIKLLDEVRWSVKIEKKSLPIRKGNTKSQLIEGYIMGLRQLAKVAYILVDRNNDGDYESLEYTTPETKDTEQTIYCHLK